MKEENQNSYEKFTNYSPLPGFIPFDNRVLWCNIKPCSYDRKERITFFRSKIPFI